MRFDPTFVLREIDALPVTHPDVWADDELRELAVASQTSFPEIMAEIVRRIIRTEKHIESNDGEMSDLKRRQQRFERRIESLRSLAMKLMNHAELRKVELPRATLSIRTGPRKVIITDETALPPDCIRIRTEPNRDAIKKQLARGEQVSGAEMSNAEDVLAITK